MTQRDNWYISAVTFFALTVILCGGIFLYIFYRDWHGFGGLAAALLYYNSLNIVVLGGAIGAIFGLVSYLKNGRKSKSLVIFCLNVVLAIAPFPYVKYQKYSSAKKQLSAFEAQSPTQKLYGLVSRYDFQIQNVEMEFVNLLKQGADINSTELNSVPMTVLGYCLDYHSDPKIIEFFVDHGADINLQDKEGKSPLHIAADRGNPEIIKALLNYGADTTLANKFGQTALSIAKAHVNRIKKYPESEINRQQLNRFMSVVSLLQTDLERRIIENNKNPISNKELKRKAQSVAH